MFSNLVRWAFAPEWLTLAQAAELMGKGYTEDDIGTLIDLGAVVAEVVDGALLVEKHSLYEYREALREVLGYERA